MKAGLKSNLKTRLANCLLALVVAAGAAGVASTISLNAALAAPDAFTSAKGKYEKKDYQGALNDFKDLSGKYPNNALCHYYMALCNQCLNRVGESKKEYQWVIDHDRSSLASQATAGLNQLGGVHNGSSSGSSGSSGSATAGAYTAIGANASKSAGGTVKMVLDFYTTWCGPCKQMEPAFEAAKGQYRAITFKRYDAEDPANAALVKQFAVHAYPTIVMIDGKGKVLYNEAGGLPDDELAKTIDQVNGK